MSLFWLEQGLAAAQAVDALRPHLAGLDEELCAAHTGHDREPFPDKSIVCAVLLRRLAASPPAALRDRLCEALRQLGPDGVCVPLDRVRPLVAKRQPAAVRVAAAAFLEACTADDRNAVLDAVRKTLSHRNRSVVTAALRALRPLGADMASGALPELKSLLKRGRCEEDALSALAWLGADASGAIDEVIGALRSEPRRAIVDAAVRAILAIAPGDQPGHVSANARTLLREGLTGPAREQVLAAARALGQAARGLRRQLSGATGPTLEPGPDGPADPSGVRWHGRHYRLTAQQFRLFRSLWGQAPRRETDVIIEVWDDENTATSTVRKTLSQLNKRLKEYDIPVRYSRRGGQFYQV